MTTQPHQALVCDDEADAADVLARLLTNEGIPHRIAHDAEEALSILKKNIPTMRLIIIDLHLPGMNGWELLRRLRSDPATQNVLAIAVTAYHANTVQRDALAAGFDAYFAKPIEAGAFLRELARVMNP
jgi:CheY-like chemotaxis protein